jgi:hypothetical protein
MSQSLGKVRIYFLYLQHEKGAKDSMDVARLVADCRGIARVDVLLKRI